MVRATICEPLFTADRTSTGVWHTGWRNWPSLWFSDACVFFRQPCHSIQVGFFNESSIFLILVLIPFWDIFIFLNWISFLRSFNQKRLTKPTLWATKKNTCSAWCVLSSCQSGLKPHCSLGEIIIYFSVCKYARLKILPCPTLSVELPVLFPFRSWIIFCFFSQSKRKWKNLIFLH